MNDTITYEEICFNFGDGFCPWMRRGRLRCHWK